MEIKISRIIALSLSHVGVTRDVATSGKSKE